MPAKKACLQGLLKSTGLNTMSLSTKLGLTTDYAYLGVDPP